MLLNKSSIYFSFKSLLKFIIVFAVVIQLIVISYNHFTGYYVLENWQHFFLRLLRGTILSTISGFLLAYPDLYFIKQLNKFAEWNEKPVLRILIQIFLITSLAVIISLIITVFANWVSKYTENFTGVLINNALLYIAANVILVSILEGWIYYSESKKAKQQTRELQQELSQIKFEVLKSQINPHFIFNSLNVLSGLMNKDIEKAQQFIDEFSHIYRYVLETIEHSVSKLGKELDFMQSYLFLQQIRYGYSLNYSVKIDSKFLNYYLPPLTLQLILENAIKHNIINEAKPLKIELYTENDFLIVKNNLQPKISSGNSMGLGIKNLTKRYNLISDVQPLFFVETNYYIAKLPLIKEEYD